MEDYFIISESYYGKKRVAESEILQRAMEVIAYSYSSEA